MLTRGMTLPLDVELPLGQDVAAQRPVGCREWHQSLASFAHGIVIRTRRPPKSIISVVSSWTLTTRPRPCVSCVTWSCSANCSAGGAGGATPNGLVGRWRRAAARAGFIITSMRPRGSPIQRLGDPLPATRLVVHRPNQESSRRVGQFGGDPVSGNRVRLTR